MQVPIQTARKSVMDGAMKIMFASVMKVIWDNIVKQLCVFHSVLMEENVLRRPYAHVPTDFREDIVRAVSSRTNCLSLFKLITSQYDKDYSLF